MKDILFEFWQTHSDFIVTLGRRALFTLIIVIAGIILIRTAGKVIHRLTSKIPRFDESFASTLRIIMSYSIFIVCVLMILDIFGVNTTSLVALLGAAGITAGLALKDTLSNIAAGIMLLFLRSYHKDDFIEFGAITGTVKKIDLLTTTLETPEGVCVLAPNASIWGVPLKNYTCNQRRRMELCVRVSYGDSLDTAFRVMHEIAAAETRFLPDPAPQVMVQSLGESAVTVMLRAWAHPDQYWPVYWEQQRNVKEKIEAAGLTIPFPQITVSKEQNI